MVSATGINGGAERATGLINSGSGFLSSAIQWVKDLDPFYKMIIVLLVIYVIYLVWEINKYFNEEKRKITLDLQIQGVK